MLAIIVLGVIFVLLWILLLIAAYQKATNAVCISKKRLDGKTAIVTGGTSGMGLETAKDFALRGARVLIACPYEDEGLKAQKLIIEEAENNNVEFKLLNLASLESTRQFAADILNNEDRLDILVNNAGIGAPHVFTKDGLNIVMQVNYFGAFLLTLLLLPLLRKTGISGEPSRIVNVSSASHAFGIVDINNLNTFDNYMYQVPVYARSKLCLVLFSQELAKRIKYWNVIVNNVDPGAAGTNLFFNWGKIWGIIISNLFSLLFKTPWQGAQTAIYVSVDKKAGEVSGAYFKNCQLSKAGKRANDVKLSQKLWEESIRIVRLSNEEIDECFKLF